MDLEIKHTSKSWFRKSHMKISECLELTLPHCLPPSFSLLSKWLQNKQEREFSLRMCLYIFYTCVNLLKNIL